MVRLPIILKPGSDARGINTGAEIYAHLKEITDELTEKHRELSGHNCGR